MPLKVNIRLPKTKPPIEEDGPAAEPFDAPHNDPDLLEEDEILSSAREALNRLRLRLPSRPKNADGTDQDYEFPPDISEITDEELGRLHGYYTAMVAYVGPQLAMMDSRHLITKENEKFAKVKAQLTATGKRVKDREAEAALSPKAKVQLQVHLTRVAQYKLLNMVYEGYVAKMKACSREITRRDPQRHNREP